MVRFLSIRVISDDAHGDLPDEITAIMNPSGVYRVGATLRSLWRRPSSVKDFWKLYEHSIEAADRLSKFIIRCLDDLPARPRSAGRAGRVPRLRGTDPFISRFPVVFLKALGVGLGDFAIGVLGPPTDHERLRMRGCSPAAVAVLGLGIDVPLAGQVPDAGIAVGIGRFRRVDDLLEPRPTHPARRPPPE